MRNWSHHRILCGLILCFGSAVSGASEPKVRLIATGGTIAGGSTKTLSAVELLQLASQLSGIASVSAEDHLALGSTRMTPELQFGLAERVNELFAEEPELAGIVITHGTDSLEETAFLLDLLVGDDRPVVFAAAMRAPRRSDSDAPRSLENAVRLAASGARGLGVVVTLNDEIHAARDVRKTHTWAYDAFKSRFGPLGYFDGNDIYLARRPTRRLSLDVDDIEPRIALVRMFSGSDGSLVRAAVDAGTRGIVIEVFGRGNVPPKVMAAVREARERDVTVVFASRTGGGRVELDEQAERIGVISGQDLDGLKARLVLVAALATTQDPETLEGYFERLSGKLGD